MLTHMLRCTLTAVSCMAAILLPGSVIAEVVKAESDGFVVRIEIQVAGQPGDIYAAMTERVAEWWHPAHTYSGQADNLYIEAQAQGCFCETLPGGGSVQHMLVVFAAPGRLLRMQGGLGPLQGLAVTGSLSWHLHAMDEGTRLELTYNVAGYLPDGLDAWARPVESVLQDQVSRLKRLVETGSAEDSPETDDTG